jgi:UDP-N-acetylglucosamine--N-acetylmuramyl-(pentapeptide) pyrophosphoryl-undecaprenol N-acetylglucosamine transferase
LNSLILIAAGGTGGHVFPGLAVAEEISRRAPEVRVEFVGSSAPLGLERRLVPRAGLPLHLLPAFPLNTPSLTARLKGAVSLPWAMVKAVALLVRKRPRAVLGIGGYASGPLMLMAALLRIKTMLLEPNALPGFTNRVLKPFVDKAGCAFEVTLPVFGDKAILTGNPVRSSFQAMAPKVHSSPTTLLCFGGSQGSRILSEGLVNALDALPGQSDLAIVHQTGPAQFEKIQAAYREKERAANVAPFIDDMWRAFADADVVLCRAGATTIAELTVAGKAAILVPLKGAADDHQTFNARAMADAGAAVMIEEKDLGSLAGVLTSLVSDPARITAMDAKARSLGRPDAAARVADVLLTWARA